MLLRRARRWACWSSTATRTCPAPYFCVTFHVLLFSSPSSPEIMAACRERGGSLTVEADLSYISYMQLSSALVLGFAPTLWLRVRRGAGPGQAVQGRMHVR
jgi:hypothetical protein